MASTFHITDNTVIVELSGNVDGCDVMGIHSEEGFLTAARQYKRVIYDYRKAKQILFGLEDAEAFAKLAGVETQITPTLKLGVIIKDKSQLSGTELYQSKANALGADVQILTSYDEL